MKNELPMAAELSDRLPVVVEELPEVKLPARIDGKDYIAPRFSVQEFLDGEGYDTGKRNIKGRAIRAKDVTRIVRHKINSHYEGLTSKQRNQIFEMAMAVLRPHLLGQAAVIEAKAIEEGWEKFPVGFRNKGNKFIPYEYRKPKVTRAEADAKKLEEQVFQIRKDMFISLLDKGMAAEEAQDVSKVNDHTVKTVLAERAAREEATKSIPPTEDGTPATES